MTVNRWPDTLPQASADGFDLSPVDQSLRTNMEVGAQRVRRRTFADLDRMNVEFRMTETQFTAFRAFAKSADYSLSGASDDISAWALFGSTRTVGGAAAPDGIAVDRMMETSATSVHRATYTLTGAAVDNAMLVCSASLKSVGGRNARLTIVDRASASDSVDIDLAAGTLSGATGLSSYSIVSRGNGWWRVTITCSTGSGGTVPAMRINATDAGTLSYAGDTGKGLDIAETQARFQTGYDLWLPTGADGKVLGSGGGSSWFQMPIASGGGLTTGEARFTGPYKVATTPALRRIVTGEVEVRNA